MNERNFLVLYGGCMGAVCGLGWFTSAPNKFIGFIGLIGFTIFGVIVALILAGEDDDDFSS
jgi:hypothetical protein